MSVAIAATPELTGVFLRRGSRDGRGSWMAIWKAGVRVQYVQVVGVDEFATPEAVRAAAEGMVTTW